MKKEFPMHMADALLSPAVGGTMWAAASGLIAYCSHKVRKELDTYKVPLMGVLGAFIFAAQMINFTIPGTGSSGHLGGGLLLAILLGPYAAFLTIASVLVIQALFFADGGLLALGCNIFNLGFFPAFIAYPFIYKKLVNNLSSQKRMSFAAVVAAVAALQMGAFGVVSETFFSGISALPFTTFVLLMQPVHFAVGLVEGVVTAAVVAFIRKAHPEILDYAASSPAVRPMRAVVVGIFMAALLTGGVFSWFASENPDGLEWSIAKITGQTELDNSGSIHRIFASVQNATAILPEYSFKTSEHGKQGTKMVERKGAINGISLSGILGGICTLIISFLIGFLLKKPGKRRPGLEKVA
jgi:cobalt/nickel transport system permease protein